MEAEIGKRFKNRDADARLSIECVDGVWVPSPQEGDTPPPDDDSNPLPMITSRMFRDPNQVSSIPENGVRVALTATTLQEAECEFECRNGGACDAHGDCLCGRDFFGQFCENQKCFPIPFIASSEVILK